jgi:hypothetical protein
VGFAEAQIVGQGNQNYMLLSASITPAPEPSSLVPLAGIGWLVFGLTRRFGKKSAT